MRRLALLLVFLAGGAVLAHASSLPRKFTFDSSLERAGGARIAISEVDPDFPRDWSGYEALVLEMRASSAQRFSLKIHTGDEGGEPRFSRVMFQPYPKVWIRAAIPVSLLSEPPKTGHDMAAVGNRSRPGYFLGLWGPFVPLTSVREIEIEMGRPIGAPSLEIRRIELVKHSPGDAVVEGAPFVDQFGQFIHDKWSGKAESLKDLERAWREEERALRPGSFGYCPYGGYKHTVAEATGFFRVEKIDGKWWFIDPDGHLFLSVGSDVIGPSMVTHGVDRAYFFEKQPPADIYPPRRFDGDRGVSFFTWNLHRRFGKDWLDKWLDLTVRRLNSWGLNTVANWSDSRLWATRKVPYVIPLASWLTDTHYLGLPDVYSEDFVKAADQRAREQCERRKDDPWLIGYFLANEPPFPQKELQTVDLILSGPETATKAELKKWLAAGDTPQRRKEFIDRAFDRYVQVTSAAVKKYDPNHLNLGMRSGGSPTEAEIRAARMFDVYSVNIYDYQVAADRIRRISDLTGKPVLVGEFHFGTPGRGLSAGLVQVRDQRERGTAYRYYVEQAFAMPEMIGTHWFQWVDQPCTGRFDGENYNIGLVDVTDRPYPELIKALKETHRRLYKVHSGEIKPFAVKPAVN
ncbi:MAG TPA: hypothetical protein PLP42_15685 [Acidobacteriota bacterium]|nr:hypothetical protein [Acidobacteriota bacterium]